MAAGDADPMVKAHLAAWRLEAQIRGWSTSCHGWRRKSGGAARMQAPVGGDAWIGLHRALDGLMSRLIIFYFLFSLTKADNWSALINQ
jgi:hypothetical protein